MHPAASLSFGLNAPAGIITLVFDLIVDQLQGGSALELSIRVHLSQIVQILGIVGVWYLIGWWLDLRNAGESKSKNNYPALITVTTRLLLLALGVFFLAVSLHWTVSSQVELISRALLQTWAFLLIAGPIWSFTGWILARHRSNDTTLLAPIRVWFSRRFSNIQLIAIGASVFLLLIVLGFLVNRFVTTS
jgi:hypothetical protein